MSPDDLELEPTLRVVDAEGNVFVGSFLAGKHVRVELGREGIFLRFVRTDEAGPQQQEKLRRALDWAEETSPIALAVTEVAVTTKKKTKKTKKPRGKRKKG